MVNPLLLLALLSCGCSATVPLDLLMNDTFRFWSALRDPSNGLWCKGIDFQPGTACDGTGKYGSYASAGVGMGLVSDALFAELGLLPMATARAQSLQTLRSLEKWPHDGKHGFYIHWTDPTFTQHGGSYSTVDTAELVLGALLSGNYFGGDVQAAAEALARSVEWSAAMNMTDGSIVATFEPNGTAKGGLRSFNEYYTAACIHALARTRG
jgi:hypothetical protein